jgi:hypothetical protein
MISQPLFVRDETTKEQSDCLAQGCESCLGSIIKEGSSTEVAFCNRLQYTFQSVHNASVEGAVDLDAST